MNEVAQEWINKAEGDYLTATREADASPPNYDAVCFHAQQCIEKLLKALLTTKGFQVIFRPIRYTAIPPPAIIIFPSTPHAHLPAKTGNISAQRA